MSKYKVGDIAMDPSEPDYTFLIVKVYKNHYSYKIFLNGEFINDNNFDTKTFEEETRKQTKLERALK